MAKKTEEDLIGLKSARTILTRRGIDVSRADVRVQNGILYIRGAISAVAGSNIQDLGAEIERVAHVIRQKPEIRNVILDVTWR